MINQLFEKALNIQKPYFIADVKFDEQKKQLDIHVDFERGSTFKIKTPDGKEVEGKAYDTVKKTWRHLNFFEHECFLHAWVPRIKHDNGIKQVETPWEGIANGFTLLFEALMMMMCLAMPVYKVSKILHVSDDKIWRTLTTYVKRAIQQTDLSGIKAVGMDETSRARGHDYITLFVDLDKRNTIFVTEGKDSSTIQEFAKILVERNGHPDNILEVSCDMSPAFIKGVRENLQNAEITFDRFHVMKFLTDAVDLVRREENRSDPTLKRLRYLFLRNECDLKPDDKSTLDALRLAGTAQKTLKAHLIKERFRDIYQAESLYVFKKLLKKWYFWASHSRIKPIIDAARSIKKHWDGIIRWKETGYTNAILEGLNSIIQAVKARARGYRNPENFKTMVYLVTGKLNFSTLNPNLLPT